MPTVTLAKHAMATRFELVLHGANEAALRAAGEEALAEVDRLENQLSLYRPGSEIAQLNARAAREPVRVSPEVFALLQHAAQLSAETEGAFDITIAPLVRCWGFMNKSDRACNSSPETFSLSSPKGGEGRGEEAQLFPAEPRNFSAQIPSPQPSPRSGGERESGRTPEAFPKGLPTPEEIAAARAVIGMQHVLFDPAERTVRFARPGVMLDLGAIGKGYAIERGAAILREAGVTSALFHGGTSTVCAIGHPPDAEHWQVALPPLPGALASGRREPRGNSTNNPIAADCPALQLRDESVSVSAIWGRSFEAEGKLFGHVLDPRLGEPVTGAVMSAVILPAATETDALSTALLTLGFAGHAKIHGLRPGMRSLIVDANGVIQSLPA